MELSRSSTLGEGQLSRRAARQIERLSQAVERVTFLPCNRLPRGEYGRRVLVESAEEASGELDLEGGGFVFTCETGRRPYRAAFFLLGGALAGLREEDLSSSLSMINHVDDEIYDLFEPSERDFKIKGTTEYHVRFYIPAAFSDCEVSPRYGSAKGERIVGRLKLYVHAESLAAVVALQAYLDERCIRVLLDIPDKERAAARAATADEIRAYRERRLIERREIPRMLRIMEEEPDELPANAWHYWTRIPRLPIGIQLAQMLRSWAEGGGCEDFKFLRRALEGRSQAVLVWIGKRNAGYRCMIESHLRSIVRARVWTGGRPHVAGVANPAYLKYQANGGWLASEMRHWRPKLEPVG